MALVGGEALPGLRGPLDAGQPGDVEGRGVRPGAGDEFRVQPEIEAALAVRRDRQGVSSGGGLNRRTRAGPSRRSASSPQLYPPLPESGGPLNRPAMTIWWVMTPAVKRREAGTRIARATGRPADAPA